MCGEMQAYTEYFHQVKNVFVRRKICFVCGSELGLGLSFQVQPENLTRLEPLLHIDTPSPRCPGICGNKVHSAGTMELILHKGTPENDFSTPRYVG